MPDPKQEMRDLLSSGTAGNSRTSGSQGNFDESGLRDPGDYAAMRREIFRKAEESVKSMEPVSNRKYILKVEDVDWKDNPDYDSRDIITAVRKGQTLSRNLTGRFALYDTETGEEVQKSGRKNLMNVPYFTDDGTFVLDGTEMGFTKQQRLSPGVYTQKKQDGTVESKFNVGKGGGFRMMMRPATGVFYLRAGNKHIPAYHLFRAMGVQDETLRERWGDLYKVNASKKLNRAHEQWIQEQAQRGWNLIDKENHPKDDNFTDMANGLRANFAARTLDSDKVEETLGMKVDRVTPEVMLRSTKAIREVYNNERPSDNLDSLRFQQVLDFPDRLEESILRDRTGQQKRNLWNITRKNDIGAIPASAFDSYVSDLFLNSGNQQVLEQTNPLGSLDQSLKLTKFGEGGLPSIETATSEARGVQLSSYPYIDQSRSVESLRVGLDTYLSEGTKIGPDRKLYKKMINTKTGKQEYVDSQTAARSVVGFPSFLKKNKDKKYVDAISGDEMKTLSRDEVDYVLPEGGGAGNIFSNTIPLQSGVKGMRKLMGCLAPDTEIIVSRSSGELIYTEIKDYVRQEGDTIPSCSEKGKVTWQPVRGVKENTEQLPMLHITVDSGAYLRTTVNHQWVISNVEGHLVKVLAEDLKEGDSVPVQLKALSTDTSVQWGEITQIKADVPEDVTYDLDVDDQTFMCANGIYVHNSKFIGHALPLSNPDAPLVTTPSSDGTPIEQHLGEKAGARYSPADGTVEEVHQDRITVKDNQGKQYKVPIYYHRPYSRKSVSGSSIIHIKKYDGSFWIGKIEDYIYEDGDKTLSYDPETKKSAWKKVKGYEQIPLEDKTLLRINTRSGRGVTVTEDHSLVTLSDDGTLVPVLPKELRVGDELPVSLMVKEKQDKTLYHDGYVDLTYDQGVLDGLYLSEGWTSNSHRTRWVVTIACKPKGRQQEIVDLLKRMNFNSCVSGGRISFSSRSCATRFKDLFSRLSHNKKISHFLLHSNEKYKQGLIQGYLAGDGGYNSGREQRREEVIEAGTVSKRLNRDLFDLLSTLGIFCKFREQHFTNPVKRNSYLLGPKASDMSKLDTWYFYSDREQQRVDYKKENARSTMYDNVPTYKTYKNTCLNGHPWKVVENLTQEKGKFLSEYDKKMIRSYEHLSKHRLADLQGNFGQWARSDIVWDQITGIYEVPDEEWVYDLAVEDSEVFAVDHGLLVHNSSIHSYPKVRKGDQVQKGNLLATSDYTDSRGNMALTKNLRTALMVGKGKNYEDAHVISQSAADKLRAKMMMSPTFDTDEEHTLSKKEFLKAFPGRYTPEQLDKIDEDGTPRLDVNLDYGDPVFLAVRDRPPTETTLNRPLRTDSSRTWDHESVGHVVRSSPKESGHTVDIETEMSAKEGDKACYDDETEILTNEGWKYFSELTLEDSVASLNPDNHHIEYLQPEQIQRYDHNGKMYRIASQQLDLCVTPNHNMYMKKRYDSSFNFNVAESIKGKRAAYKKNGIWEGVRPEYITIPGYSVKCGQGGVSRKDVEGLSLPVIPYLRLLGMYISEGWTSIQLSNGTYQVGIAQMKPESTAIMERWISELGLKYNYYQNSFRIYNKSLTNHFKILGLSYEKYIPNWVFTLAPDLLEYLLEALIRGDGTVVKTTGCQIYFTSSYKLAGDIQRLCLHTGRAGNVYERKFSEEPLWSGTNWIIQKHQPYSISIITKKCTPSVNHSYVKEQKAQTERYEDYNGNVWCCTLPRNHILYVRRNGKPVWSGNSIPWGTKGVAAEIKPDERMPRDSQGNPMELLLNSLSVSSRSNPSTISNMALGKVAQQTGRQYVLPGTFED